jgi:lipopolysaccharide export system permease protein
MRLLDRYLLKELMGSLGYCLAAILVFWTAFELLGEMDQVGEEGVGFLAVAGYLGHRMPLSLGMQLPVALLLGTLYAVGRHARHFEWVAMRAAGGECVADQCSLPGGGHGGECGVDGIERMGVAGRGGSGGCDAGSERGSGCGRSADVAGESQFPGSLGGEALVGATVSCGDGGVGGGACAMAGEGKREEMLAERGAWVGDRWVFEEVTRFQFPDGADGWVEQQRLDRWEATGFPERPEHLRSEVKIGRLLGGLKKSRQVQLSLREIGIYQELHPQLERVRAALLDTWFHDRLATPWTCLVVVLIALPAAAGSGRRNAFVGVAAAVFVAFGFFVIKEFSLALGSGGYLVPWLAAWLPNVIFGGVGAWGIHRLR